MELIDAQALKQTTYAEFYNRHLSNAKKHAPLPEELPALLKAVPHASPQEQAAPVLEHAPNAPFALQLGGDGESAADQDPGSQEEEGGNSASDSIGARSDESGNLSPRKMRRIE